MNNNLIINLFASCKLVKGYLRSLIYDLQWSEYYFIPNELYDILQIYNGKSVQSLNVAFSEDDRKIINNCLDFLLDKELIFFSNKEESGNFPHLNTDWETPNILDNFILDINETSNLDYKKIFCELNLYMPKTVQLRFFYTADLPVLNSILHLIDESYVRTVELIVADNSEITVNDWKKLADKYTRLTNLTIYKSTKKDIAQYKQATIIYIAESVSSHKDCGVISKDILSCNNNLFCESQSYNTCINGKASIDVNGEIKNCPSMLQSFGNIKNTPLKQAIDNPDFKKFWKITKDQIKVCKDCEFRYMCTDCRAYIKDSADIYSQPAKCTYNPYIAKWQGEDGYFPVEISLKELQIVP